MATPVRPNTVSHCLRWHLVRGALCLLAFCAAASDALQAQLTQPAPRGQQEIEPGKTTVRFEIGGERGSGVEAQKWSELIGELGASIRIMGVTARFEPGVTERVQGTLRYVTVRGMLDRSGKLIFPDRSFTRKDFGKLKEWIDELKTYGAQGRPQGKPLWGLNRQQFVNLYQALAIPVTEQIAGLTVGFAVQKLAISEDYPVEMSQDGRAWILKQRLESETVRQKIKGFSKGTGLALLLNEFGLCFRPVRTPSGAITLIIQPLAETPDPWPVGWPLPEDTNRFEVAPKLFEIVEVELDEVPYLEVMHAIALKSGIPIRFDDYNIRVVGKMNLEELRVSYPNRKGAWTSVIRGVSAPNRLAADVMLDEAQEPFLWITTLKAQQAARKSPDESRPRISE